jgi:hypothetical protein
MRNWNPTYLPYSPNLSKSGSKNKKYNQKKGAFEPLSFYSV